MRKGREEREAWWVGIRRTHWYAPKLYFYFERFSCFSFLSCFRHAQAYTYLCPSQGEAATARRLP